MTCVLEIEDDLTIYLRNCYCSSVRPDVGTCSQARLTASVCWLGNPTQLVSVYINTVLCSLFHVMARGTCMIGLNSAYTTIFAVPTALA